MISCIADFMLADTQPYSLSLAQNLFNEISLETLTHAYERDSLNSKLDLKYFIGSKIASLSKVS